MRIAAVILAALAVALALATWLRSDDPGPADPAAASRDIRVTGRGNTLASIARTVNQPQRFHYDPLTRTATCYATLIIEGELQLGAPGNPESGETLQLATRTCGDLRIGVRPQGTLRLHHSAIRTVSRVLTNNACSQGYSLFVDGSLAMDHSHISYISGSTSQCLRGNAEATIRHSTFSYCDGSALSCVNVDGGRITIEDSIITGAGNWGLVVRGSGGAPLELRDCVLDGKIGAVFVAGGSARARLTDCTFDSSKIVFNSDSGEVAVAWTRLFKLADAKSGTPRSGLRVRAENDSTDAAEGRTNAEGLVELALVEWFARPGSPKGGRDGSDPVKHRVSVLDDQGQTLAVAPEVVARGKDPATDRQAIVIDLP